MSSPGKGKGEGICYCGQSLLSAPSSGADWSGAAAGEGGAGLPGVIGPAGLWAQPGKAFPPGKVLPSASPGLSPPLPSFPHHLALNFSPSGEVQAPRAARPLPCSSPSPPYPLSRLFSIPPQFPSSHGQRPAPLPSTGLD